MLSFLTLNFWRYSFPFTYLISSNLEQISQALLSTDRAADYISNFPEIASSLQQEPEVHINRLMCILGSLSHLRADIYWKMKKSREIYHQAEAISDELLKWADRSLSTIELSSRGGHILACHAMNQYRAAQLSVNSILSAYSSFGSRPGPKGFGSDICASVPFHLHAGLTKVPSLNSSLTVDLTVIIRRKLTIETYERTF